MKYSCSKVHKKVKRLVGKAIADYDLLQNDDKVLVGISGGKDSIVMMSILTELQRRAPINYELHVATFDPGFSNDKMDNLRKFFKEQGWSFHIVSSDVFSLLQKQKTTKPCALCSRVRRGALYELARKLNCNKLALGHNLDDIIVSLLIGLTRGGGVTTMAPCVSANDNNIQIIRPLCYVEDKLVKELASSLCLENYPKCKFADMLDVKGDRAYFMNYLNLLENRIPNVRRNFLNSMQHVEPGFLLDKKFFYLQDHF